MSTADQILSARISGVCRRHCARGVVDDLDTAVAELQALAGDRPDLLAEHAGLSLGVADGCLPALALRYRVEAELAIAAGADGALIELWIMVGRAHAEAARAVPYTEKGRQGLGEDEVRGSGSTLREGSL